MPADQIAALQLDILEPPSFHVHGPWHRRDVWHQEKAESRRTPFPPSPFSSSLHTNRVSSCRPCRVSKGHSLVITALDCCVSRSAEGQKRTRFLKQRKCRPRAIKRTANVDWKKKPERGLEDYPEEELQGEQALAVNKTWLGMVGKLTPGSRSEMYPSLTNAFMWLNILHQLIICKHSCMTS